MVVVVIALVFFAQVCLSSPILDFFSENNVPSDAANESPDHDFVPEVNGGVMTEFFQTYSIIGEDTKWSEEQTGEEQIKNVPEIEIDVHEFLLITDPELQEKPRSDKGSESPNLGVADDMTLSEKQAGVEKIKNVPEIEIDDHDFLLLTDPELKAKPRSDNGAESLNPEVGLFTVNQLMDKSTVPVLLNFSSTTTPQPIQSEEVISTSTVSSTSPPVPSASTPEPSALTSEASASTSEASASTSEASASTSEASASTSGNLLLSSTSSASVESLTSDSLISTSTTSLAGAATTNLETLLFELDRLNKLNAAVADLHTHEDQSITTETAQDQAQDRTDIIDDSLDETDDESYDFFTDMWNWLG